MKFPTEKNPPIQGPNIAFERDLEQFRTHVNAAQDALDHLRSRYGMDKKTIGIMVRQRNLASHGKA